MDSFDKWGEGVEPIGYTTKEEVKEMIDDAIRQHNVMLQLLVSVLVGLFLSFSEGLLRLIGVIPPLVPWMDITLK